MYTHSVCVSVCVFYIYIYIYIYICKKAKYRFQFTGLVTLAKQIILRASGFFFFFFKAFSWGKGKNLLVRAVRIE